MIFWKTLMAMSVLALMHSMALTGSGLAARALHESDSLILSIGLVMCIVVYIGSTAFATWRVYLYIKKLWTEENNE